MCFKYIVLPNKSAYSKIFSVKPEPITTLWYTLHNLPDYRRAKGKRHHDLPTLITLAILAMCCGSTSYLAMQEWCENYQKRLGEQLPFLANHLPNTANKMNVLPLLILWDTAWQCKMKLLKLAKKNDNC